MRKIEMPQQEKRTLEFQWKDGEYPTVYSNQIGVGMTPFDLAIVFGEVQNSDEATVTGIPRVKILLAPEQASNLIQLLTVALEHYSNANGPLRTSGAVDPVELQARIERQNKKVN